MPSLAELLAEQGRVLADDRRRQGARRGALVTSLAQLPGQIRADRQAEQLARAQQAQAIAQGIRQQRTDARLDAADERDQGRYEGQQATAEAQAARAAQLEESIAAGLDPETGAFTVAASLKHAHAKGYRGIATDLVKFARENRPAAPPNLVQGDPTRAWMNPATGAIVQPATAQAVPPTPPNPTEASLAAEAALGNPRAARALEILRSQRAPQGGGSAANNEPLETIIGPDGKAIRVRRSDAVGQAPAAGTERSSSGLQKKTLGYFNRMQQADVDLEGMEEQIRKMGISGQARMATMPNVLQSDLGQSYTQAQRAFTEARLRKDSGAAIPEHEFASDRKTYFVQPGDSEATIAQKRRARGAMLASLGFESGQALGEYMGDAEEAKALIESFKARAKKTDAAAPKVGDTKTFPNGRKATWDGQGWEPVR